MASFNTIRQLFFAIFLTDVVGLRPGLAAYVALIGALWDAINDPIIGALSDRVRTRWGRRRPFLLIFAVPFSLAFVILWWAPPWESQLQLMLHMTAAYMIADTLQTLIVVPFLSMTPELTEDYDERTSLTTFRMIFNMVASLAAAVAAPELVKTAPTLQQGYLMMAGIFGLLGATPFILIFFSTREREDHIHSETPGVLESFKAGWENVPFRIVTLINVFNWIAFDIIGLMLPYFLTYWVESGRQRTSIPFPIFGTMTLESVVFFVLMATALAFLPFWSWLSRVWSKRNAYIFGMLFWMVVQLLIWTIQPGQRTYILLLAFFAGISVATAHVLPEALFPDVLEWDELRTGKRREGLYYGVKALIRKFSSAFAIFIALRVLGAYGYVSPAEGASIVSQSEQVNSAIRFLTGPAGAVFLIGAIITAFFYPLSREKHRRILILLERKRKRSLTKLGMPGVGEKATGEE